MSSMYLDPTVQTTQASIPLMGKEKPVGTGTSHKTQSCAQKALSFLKDVLTFPLRYLGSKSWSLPGLICRFPIVTIKHIFCKNLPMTYAEELFGTGYHRFGNPVMEPKAVNPFVKYSCVNAAVQGNSSHYVEPFGYKNVSPHSLVSKLDLPKTMEANKTCFFDKKSGLKLAVYQKGDEVIIGYGALAGADSEIQDQRARAKVRSNLIGSGLESVAGFKAQLFKDAESIFNQLKALPEFAGKRIVLTGQCLGGTIASFISLKNRCQGVAFNSMPIGVGLQEEIGQKNLMDSDKYVIHIIATTDYMANLPSVVGVLDAAINFIGIKTPGNFGKKYLIPTSYQKAFDTHRFILGSMMAHIGFNCRTMPDQVQKNDPKAVGMFD